MKIKKGGTRIVFVFRKFVVKIPRINIFRALYRLFLHIKRNDIKQSLLAFSEKSLTAGAIEYIFAGFFSNYRECNFYKNHKSMEMLVPVKCNFFGLILVQEKAFEIEEDIFPEWFVYLDNFLLKNFSDDKNDLCVSRNFGIHRGKIKLLDYGKESTAISLERIYL